MRLDLLRKKRLELGWDLKDVHKKTGVSISTISLYERSQATPAADKLERICTAIGLKLSDVLK